MITAHLPGGYILTRALQVKLKTKSFLWLGLVGSIFPDLDILYYILVGKRWLSHREFWMHIPIYWIGISLAVFIILALARKKTWYPAAIIFFANVFLHLILDTVIGGIKWLYPFSNTGFYLTIVPARYDFWLWSFIFHWTFWLEIAIIVAAACVFIKDLRSWLANRPATSS